MFCCWIVQCQDTFRDKTHHCRRHKWLCPTPEQESIVHGGLVIQAGLNQCNSRQESCLNQTDLPLFRMPRSGDIPRLRKRSQWVDMPRHHKLALRGQRDSHTTTPSALTHIARTMDPVVHDTQLLSWAQLRTATFMTHHDLAKWHHTPRFSTPNLTWYSCGKSIDGRVEQRPADIWVELPRCLPQEKSSWSQISIQVATQNRFLRPCCPSSVEALTLMLPRVTPKPQPEALWWQS